MADSKYLVESLETPCVYFDPSFLDEKSALEYYEDLLKNIKWEKTSKINRWVSLHHASDVSDYQYRDAPGDAHLGFTPTIQAMQEKAEEWYFSQTQKRVKFNVCLLNYYENGLQRIGWHSDREEKGRSTPIASISLGTPRMFQVRNKISGPQDRASFEMPNGSMVVMESVCQDLYLHSVPKQPSITTGRINLTFRCKEFTTQGEEEHIRHDEWLTNITDGAAPTMALWSPDSEADNDKDLVFGSKVPVQDLDDGFPVIQFLIKTNLGTERYCGAEIQELLDASSELAPLWFVVACPRGLDGYVACCSPQSQLDEAVLNDTTRLLLGLKSAHHVLRYHADFEIADCCTSDMSTPESVSAERLYEYFKEKVTSTENPIVIESLEKLAEQGGGTFRATCERIGGPHAFQRPQVEREMGGALAEYYAPRSVSPKMEDYDICIRVDVVGYRVIVGTQINVDDMSKDRHFLKYRNAVTVKTNIAYALVRLAGVKPGQTILDPFCGSGTLLLEAMEVFQKQLYCIGMDVSKRSAQGARENALAEGCTDDMCKFVCSDARGLRRHVKDESVDAVISNLPWGVQTGQKNSVSDLKTLYEIFLRTAWYVLKKDGKMVMLVLRGLQVSRILRKLSGRYKLLSVQVVRTTNNLPSILVVQKLERDELRENIKGQLAYMNQYVNVSPEMYQALHIEAVDEEDQ
eukprot:Nitzschia sp. Nitz4//scaffold20_size174350//106782//108935//NITZ4_002112-RA/size174350-snap-gene-0.221-mRNA-1//1//CDS//3329541839//7443//frame0